MSGNMDISREAMSQLRCAVLLVSAGAAAIGAGSVCGQTGVAGYPHKSIRIVTGEPGGGLDFATRLVVQGITGPLGQTVVVENRGGGPVLVDIVVKAAPDGYTLLLHASNIWLAPLLRDRVSYDTLKDLQPITLTSMAPNIVVANPSLPANSIRELIALAKARAGALNYSSGSTGSTSHLAVELFKAMAGVNFVRIPYKGSGPALTSVMAGEVQIMFPSAGGVSPHIKSGKLKALAVTSAQPSKLFPDMPTVAASGLPGYESSSVAALFSPARTPMAVVNRLNREIVRYLATPEANQRFLSSGVETVGSTPEQLFATMKSDIARMGKVIKDAGIREE
jgi:tripartite-type tricarboxylate transporter receptor subunit TctC